MEGTQTDKDRDTDGRGHRLTRIGTQMDRGRETKAQGKGHRRTQTDTDRDTDMYIDKLNRQLAKK